MSSAIPDRPADFFDSNYRRNTYPEHYYRWEASLPASLLGPKMSGDVVEVFGFDVRKKQLRPISPVQED